MCRSVAASAESDKIRFSILPHQATRVYMVNFEIRAMAAGLALPSISLQYLVA